MDLHTKQLLIGMNSSVTA